MSNSAFAKTTRLIDSLPRPNFPDIDQQGPYSDPWPVMGLAEKICLILAVWAILMAVSVTVLWG